MRQRERGSDEELALLDTSTLSTLSSVLGRIFSVRLDVPDELKVAPNEKKVKEFCVGLLENPVNHTWWQAVRSLGVTERVSISGSLFLARKALPVSPDLRQAEKHMRLMETPASPAPPEFLKFVEREIDRLFEPGWDRRYQAHVFSHTPTSSSCLEYPSSKGGARRFLSEGGSDWFQDACLAGTDFPTDYKVKYSVVNTGGKMRGITVCSGNAQVLGPLHRTLYDHLSQFDWLLRGDARGKKFSSFQEKEGEIFVSGDYESATDNLSLEVAELILERILSKSRSIPRALIEYALRSLRAEIHYPEGHVVRQRRGQLMGNFLSFPLLCLQNYLAFRFSIPRPVPLRINGDDIVFRCRPSELKIWKDNVGAAGLTLSAGKTLVDKRLFSLNSCFFRAGNRRVWEIPIIRLKSIVVMGEDPLSGGAFTRCIRGWKGESRRLIGSWWLTVRRSAIQSTGRSVWALGIPADNSQLHTAGFAVREAFYRGSKKHLELPEEPIPSKPQKGKDLTPWVRVPKARLNVSGMRMYNWQKEAVEYFGKSVWSTDFRGNSTLWDEWWEQVKRTGREAQWLAWRRTTKRVHRMGVTLNLILRPPAALSNVGCTWVPREFLTEARGSFRGGVGAR